jgi:APA family basic amino acid/polyamine antiporter
MFAVAGVFVLRYRKISDESTGYKTWGYPITPLIYIAITLWTVTFLSISRPLEAGVGIAMVVVGLIAYFISKRWEAAS